MNPLLFLPQVSFQAHRGGSEEFPENTLEGLVHAWQFSAAVPEVDVRSLADGRLICLHDETLARTTDAPEPVRGIPVRRLGWDQVSKVDAGIKKGEPFRGCRVPELAGVLALLAERRERRIYLDLKDVDYRSLRPPLEAYRTEGQVLFVHGDEEECARIKETFPQCATMTWCGGPPPAVRARFESLARAGFRGLGQVQLHVQVGEEGGRPVYDPSLAFIRDAFQVTADAGVDLQIRLFRLDPPALRPLLELGVRWYVADAPLRFIQALNQAVLL